jgi:hypothetical protein
MTMTTKQALEILSDMASRFGENAEEGFARRVTSNDSDESCQENADKSDNDVSDVIEIRDLWRAIDRVQQILKQKSFDPAITDGNLTSLCDLVIDG